MKLKTSQRERILAPEGVHNARCIRIIDLGTQETKWGSKRKIQLALELVDESAVFNEDKGEENFVVYKQYSMSLAPKATLTKDIGTWLNKKFNKNDEFDLESLLNAPCIVQIQHGEDEDGNVYNNVAAIMAPKKGDKVSKAKNEIYSVFLSEDEFDQENFDLLPGFMKEKLSKTPEFEECGGSYEPDEEKEESDSKQKAKKNKKKR